MDSCLTTLGSVCVFKFNLKRNLVKDFIDSLVFYHVN